MARPNESRRRGPAPYVVTVRPTTAPRFIPFWFGALVWVLLAVLFFTSAAAMYALKNAPEPFARVFWWAGAEWIIYGLLAPPAFAVVRRLPFDRRHAWRTIGWFILGWLLFHLVAQLLYVGTERTFALGGYDGQYTPLRHLVIYLLKKSPMTLLVFAGIVIVHELEQLYVDGRERERRTAQLQADLSQSRLQALRSQLQPHFLFNTLNTIASLVHRDPDGAEEVTALLGDLLRESLQEEGDSELPLRYELSFLERYLAIQRIRFTDRLRVTIAPDEETLDALVPSMILQPLVENAIRHGIEPRATPGTVWITAHRRGDRLEVSVRDDGVGLGKSGKPSQGCGVGLRNTKLRLDALYGESEPHFGIAAVAEGGTIATVTIPWRQGEPEPHA